MTATRTKSKPLTLDLKWQDPHGPRANSKPSRQQAEFLRNRTHFYKWLIGGFGSGKTAAIGYHACMALWCNRGIHGGAIGETWEKVRQDLIPAVRDVLDWSKIPYREHKTEHWIEVPKWNSRVQFMSAEEPKRIVGQNWGWLVGNEPGLWKEQAFLNARARIRMTCPWSFMAFGGTPEGFNWMYRHAVKDHPDAVTGMDPKVRVWFTKTADAVWQPEDYAADMIALYPPDLVDEKLNAIFTHVGVGAIYPHFTNDNIEPVTRDHACDLVLTLDFNIAPAIAVLHQHKPHPTLGHVIEALHEVRISRGTTADAVNAICDIIDEHDLLSKSHREIEVMGDATGKSMHATGAVCYDEVYRVLYERGISWNDRVPSSNPPRKDRYAIVNGALYHSRYLVHPRCERLIQDFREVTYKESSLQQDAGSDNSRGHMTDGAGYDIFDLFGTERETPDPLIVTPEGETRMAQKTAREVQEEKAGTAPPWRGSMRDAPWKGDG